MIDISKFIGNTEEFPVLNAWDFFNHAGVSPLPHRVAGAVRRYVDETEVSSYMTGNRYGMLDTTRASAARMINADADEIALLKNTAEGISIIARGIDWHEGDRVVTAAGEYPANVYPWMDAAARQKLQLVMVGEVADANGTRHVPLDAILTEAAKSNTRIVTLSHVEFATGQRHDLATIGQFCRQRGILFCVDAIQSLGALPVDVKAMQIDYLASGSQKWLLGPEGVGIFYCRRELIERTPPLVVGALNVTNNQDYGNYHFTLQATAGRFESGTYNMAGIFGLHAAIELLQSIGPEAISLRIKHLTDRLIEGVRAKGYKIVSPRGGEQWSGIVTFITSKHDLKMVAATLRKEHKTEIAVREARLRVAAHFYNTAQQIDRLIEHLPGC